MPAVRPKTAARMLVLLRSRRFESVRQAAAFLGLVPVERRSGRSVRGGLVSRMQETLGSGPLPTWPRSSQPS
jgi:transposase